MIFQDVKSLVSTLDRSYLLTMLTRFTQAPPTLRRPRLPKCIHHNPVCNFRTYGRWVGSSDDYDSDVVHPKRVLVLPDSY